MSKYKIGQRVITTYKGAHREGYVMDTPLHRPDGKYLISVLDFAQGKAIRIARCEEQIDPGKSFRKKPVKKSKRELELKKCEDCGCYITEYGFMEVNAKRCPECSRKLVKKIAHKYGVTYWY